MIGRSFATSTTSSLLAIVVRRASSRMIHRRLQRKNSYALFPDRRSATRRRVLRRPRRPQAPENAAGRNPRRGRRVTTRTTRAVRTSAPTRRIASAISEVIRQRVANSSEPTLGTATGAPGKVLMPERTRNGEGSLRTPVETPARTVTTGAPDLGRTPTVVWRANSRGAGITSSRGGARDGTANGTTFRRRTLISS